MGCTTSIPQTGGLVESPKPEYVEDYAATDSGIEDSDSSEPLQITKTLLQERKDGFASTNLQFLQKTFNEGVFAPIEENQLLSLWNYYCQASGVMEEVEIKSILGDYIEFCRDFSCEQIKRRKYGEKRNSARSDGEIELSSRASLTLVKCNSHRARIEELMDEIFGKRRLIWAKHDFLQRADELFSRVRNKLQMQPWADSILGPVNYDAPTGEPSWVKELQMELAEDKLKGDFTEGCLRVCIIGACGLIPLPGRESCTPYLILSIADSKVPTVCKPDTTDPEWMQTFKFMKFMFRKQTDKSSHIKETAQLHIMDWDKESRKANRLGSLSFDLPNEFMDKPKSLELPIKMKGDKTKSACVMLSYHLKPRDA